MSLRIGIDARLPAGAWRRLVFGRPEVALACPHLQVRSAHLNLQPAVSSVSLRVRRRVAEEVVARCFLCDAGEARFEVVGVVQREPARLLRHHVGSRGLLRIDETRVGRKIARLPAVGSRSRRQPLHVHVVDRRVVPARCGDQVAERLLVPLVDEALREEQHGLAALDQSHGVESRRHGVEEPAPPVPGQFQLAPSIGLHEAPLEGTVALVVRLVGLARKARLPRQQACGVEANAHAFLGLRI
jgi:hypothetical protein